MISKIKTNGDKLNNEDDFKKENDLIELRWPKNWRRPNKWRWLNKRRQPKKLEQPQKWKLYKKWAGTLQSSTRKYYHLSKPEIEYDAKEIYEALDMLTCLEKTTF